MHKVEWVKRINEFVSEIAGDDDLGDLDYVEVLQELEEAANISRMAKQEELDRAEPDA